MTDATETDFKESFRPLVENSRDILTIRDADGRIRYANPSFQRVLGYRAEEMIGTTGFDLLHPEDRPAVESALAEFWKNPGARGAIQYRARHANGSWVSLHVVAYNMLDDPHVCGVVISGRDISEQLEADKSAQSVADAHRRHGNGFTLAGVLTTCASCKKIRNDAGNWEQFEVYIRDRAPVEFSHGMCPECVTLWGSDEASE